MIGKAKTLSLGLAHSATGRFDLRSRKTLALIVALLLSVGALVFAGKEARAQQLPQVQQQHAGVTQDTVVIDGGVAETAVRAPSGAPYPVEKTPPANTSPTGLASPAGSASRVDLGAPASGTVPEPVPRTNPADPGPAPPVDPATTPEPTLQPEPTPLPTGPVPALEPPAISEPQPVTFEENEPLSSSRVEEIPASIPTVPDLAQEEVSHPSLSSLGTAVVPLESTLNIPGNLADRSPLRSVADEGSIAPVLAGSLPGVEADLAPAGGHAEDSGSPSGGGTGNPSKDTPQPSSPFTPPAGSSYFSLPGGGQVGPGGVAPLLLCVLVLGLVLLRRDGKLPRAFCEPPKPSSALLLPLERPG